MPFTLRSRKYVETPLEAAYRRQLEQHAKEKDPAYAKPAPPEIRSFPLVEDTVSLSSSMADESEQQAQQLSAEADPVQDHEVKPSAPVTLDEKKELTSQISIHV